MTWCKASPCETRCTLFRDPLMAKANASMLVTRILSDTGCFLKDVCVSKWLSLAIITLFYGHISTHTLRSIRKRVTIQFIRNIDIMIQIILLEIKWLCIMEKIYLYSLYCTIYVILFHHHNLSKNYFHLFIHCKYYSYIIGWFIKYSSHWNFHPSNF